VSRRGPSTVQLHGGPADGLFVELRHAPSKGDDIHLPHEPDGAVVSVYRWSPIGERWVHVEDKRVVSHAPAGPPPPQVSTRGEGG
jgi:hypothetical protein